MAERDSRDRRKANYPPDLCQQAMVLLSWVTHAFFSTSDCTAWNGERGRWNVAGGGSSSGRVAGFEEFRILRLRSCGRVIKGIAQGAFDGGVVEPQGNECRSWFSGSRKRNVPASHSAQSEPNAWADMQSTSTRECSRAGSILAGMLWPRKNIVREIVHHDSLLTLQP